MSDSATTSPAKGSTSRTSAIAVGAFALLFATPIALFPLLPGTDTPWHASLVSALAEGDAERFLGYFEIQAGWASYSIVYRALAGLAAVTGALWSLKLTAMAAIAGTILASASLLRAFDREPALAILAAPAAYSVTFEFGFFVFWLAVPLGIWCWALARRSLVANAPLRSLGALGACSLAVALIHPFAAAFVFACGAATTLAEPAPSRRRLAVAGVLALSLVPALLPLLRLGGGAESGSWVPEHLSLADKLALQQFSGALESLASVPARLFGFIPDALCFALFAAAMATVLVLRHPAQTSPGGSARASQVLLTVAIALYLLCPFSFLWPRVLHAAQPRLLPWVWVALLVALAPRARPSSRPALLCGGVASLTLATLWIALSPYRADARDLVAVIDRIPQRQRVLPLVEQRPALSTEPPSSMRNAGAWAVALRGGFAAYLPYAEKAGGPNVGSHLPLRLSSTAPEVPAAPLQGSPRRFHWPRHAEGWDYFLIRDRAGAPFDYFRQWSSEVEEVARSGRWRLLRRVGR